MSENPLTWNPVAELSDEQREQLEVYERLLVETNQQINLISRSDETHVHLHHTLHSLALSYKTFPARSTVVDWGTGGGLPGIPLAVRFPEVSFHVIDSTRKKILAVRRMVRQLDLDNVEAWHGRAEKWTGTVDYSVSRATASLSTLWSWHDQVQTTEPPTASEDEWKSGLLALKGGELSSEIESLKDAYPNTELNLIPLQPILGHSFFAQKAIVTVCG